MAQGIIFNCLWINHAPIRPIGAHQIADWLRKHGYSIKIIDFCNFMTPEQLWAITEANLGPETVFIGVNSTFWSEVPYITANFDKMGNKNFIEPPWIIDIRERLENRKIDWLLGGVYANFPKTYFKYDWTAFSGLAEDSVLKWMNEKTDGNNRSLFDIKTLSSRFSLDSGIMPEEVLPIELSRGCQFKCSFCRYPLLGKKKGTYIRGSDHIYDELMYNYDQFGTTKYFFMDDTVNESDEKILELEKIANRLPFKLQWVGYNRLDLIGSRPHSVDALKNSGLVSAYFGIESFHPSASKIIGKGWNGVRAKDFLLKLKDRWSSDVNFYLQFMIGLTGETEKDIEDTQEWCIRNDIPDWGFNPLSIKRDGQSYYWSSEFDSNWGLYGYKFVGDSYYEWHNHEWTYTRALQKSRELMARNPGEKRLSCWLLGEVSTHGVPMAELTSTRKSQINFKQLNIKSLEFVNNYVKNQLKI